MDISFEYPQKFQYICSISQMRKNIIVIIRFSKQNISHCALIFYIYYQLITNETIKNVFIRIRHR